MKRLIILIIVVVAVLGVAGFGGWVGCPAVWGHAQAHSNTAGKIGRILLTTPDYTTGLRLGQTI